MRADMLDESPDRFVGAWAAGFGALGREATKLLPQWFFLFDRHGFAGDLSPDEVVMRLDSLQGLFDGLVKLSDQRRRATRIEEDREKFEALVSEWTQTYAPDLRGRAPDVAAEELVRRFQAAEHHRTENGQIQADLGEITRALSALDARREQAESAHPDGDGLRQDVHRL